MESQRPEDTKALAQPQGVERTQEPTMIERRVSLDGLAYTYPEFVSSWDPRQANEMWHSAGLVASESASSNKMLHATDNAKSQEALLNRRMMRMTQRQKQHTRVLLYRLRSNHIQR